MTKQYEMTSAEVLRCIGKFSKYKGTDKIPVIFRCKENSTKDYGRQLMMEMSQMTNAYVFETGPAHMDPSLLKKIQQTYHKEKGSNEEMKERKEKVAWNTFGRPIYYDDGTKEYDDGTVVGHDGKVKATREDKETKVQRYLEFAKEILPEENIQCIWDLRSGKVWLHMLNGMFGQHYKFSKKVYKNYNNCMKILQANGISVQFMREKLSDALDGDEEAIMGTRLLPVDRTGNS